ncbi:MAG: hypothetical protein QOF94_1433, partial [Acidobacteriaceae bacterium]
MSVDGLDRRETVTSKSQPRYGSRPLRGGAKAYPPRLSRRIHSGERHEKAFHYAAVLGLAFSSAAQAKGCIKG